jgi:hypothetical protein
MTDEKKKDKKDGKEAKKIDDEQLKDVAGGTQQLLDGTRGYIATSVRGKGTKSEGSGDTAVSGEL